MPYEFHSHQCIQVSWFTLQTHHSMLFYSSTYVEDKCVIPRALTVHSRYTKTPSYETEVSYFHGLSIAACRISKCRIPPNSQHTFTRSSSKIVSNHPQHPHHLLNNVVNQPITSLVRTLIEQINQLRQSHRSSV